MDNKLKAGSSLLESPQTTDLKDHGKVTAGEDAALIRDEERIMDEEITSDEESEAARKAHSMERKLMTVALVKSVVESGAATTGGNSHDGDSPRYGLRKRRRPAGNDIQKFDYNQSSTNSGLAGVGSGIGMSQTDSRSGSFDYPAPPSISLSSTVPNPLAVAPINPPPMLASKPVTPALSAPEPTSSTTAPAIPCPLPSTDAAVVKKPEPTGAPGEPPDKRKVTINEPSRQRGFSIDLESVGLDFPEESSTNAELSLPGGGRGRAFSFECFAFGINADEPLPPLGHHDVDYTNGRPRQDSLIVEPSVTVGRPRGDSIIFDPSSFQEGGIHEQNALQKGRAPSGEALCVNARHPGAGPKTETAASCLAPPSAAVVPPVQIKNAAPLPSVVAIKPAPTIPAQAASITPPTIVSSSSQPVPSLPAVTSYTATTTTTTNSNTTTTVTVTASANTSALSMELLNKDGRIGIYLPEARKERIARFHAKRARRIWRKRIKYDCRKKLADSRPRIKGRFVKRSDMEEE